MRVWTWAISGPEEPEFAQQQEEVWDDEDVRWRRSPEGQWWADKTSVPEGSEDAAEWLYGLPWSVLMETRGPIRSKPRASVPMPPSQVDSEGR